MAHIPAITALDGVHLRALVTSTAESAAAASERWGVGATHELSRVLHDEGVDIVSVTLRVPRHAEVVEAAIGAGKHVYCEWPLAVDTAEAERLAQLSAEHPGQIHVTGLQGRFSPALRTATRVLASGRIGRPLTASLRQYMSHGLVPRPAHRAHLRHRTVAANVLSIYGGHTLDMLGTVLGPAEVVAARLWCAVPEFIVDTGERLPRDAPDNLTAILDYGGVVTTVQISQTGAGDSFELEILGTRALLRLSGTSQPQFGELTVSLTGLESVITETIPPDPIVPQATSLPVAHPAYNVASVYTALTAAIREKRRDERLPTFPAAVGLHEFLDAIAVKSAVGTAN